MNHPSFADHGWPRRSNFRSAFAASGALNFPVFLLMASFGLILLSGVFQPANALVRPTPMDFKPLQPVPSLNDESAMQLALQGHLRNSALSSGNWQPEASISDVSVSGEPELPVETETEPAAVIEAADNGVHANRLEATITRSESVAASEVDGISAPAITPRLEIRSARLVKRPAALRLNLIKSQARKALQERAAQRAYQLLMEELDRGAEDTEFLGLLAVSALALGKADEARLIYQRLVVLEPDNDQWWTGLAIAREQLGLSAAADYQRALALSGGDTATAELARSRLQETG